jgi:hypothetical protein
MNERDDERELRTAFARLREDEAQRAPSLEALLARAEAKRARRGSWLRVALPLAGAVAASAALWLATRALEPGEPDLAVATVSPEQLGGREPLIALGSLRSPTDALLAPPLASFSLEFSDSLIPAPDSPTTPASESHSLAAPPRRFPV